MELKENRIKMQYRPRIFIEGYLKTRLKYTFKFYIKKRVNKELFIISYVGYMRGKNLNDGAKEIFTSLKFKAGRGIMKDLKPLEIVS
jgi:hypothetical protein